MKMKIKNKYTERINWNEYISFVYSLCDMIKKSKIKLDGVYGIPRGGVFLAFIISHELKIHYIESHEIHEAFMSPTSTILYVDDKCDSGKTLEKYTVGEYFKTKTATIYKHKDSPLTPDFYVKTTTNWIRFPYEME